jgi:hypothetical protein
MADVGGKRDAVRCCGSSCSSLLSATGFFSVDIDHHHLFVTTLDAIAEDIPAKKHFFARRNSLLRAIIQDGLAAFRLAYN